MTDGTDPAPLAEPVAVDCHLVEGFAVETRDEFVRLAGWVYLETVEEGAVPERRLVARVAIPKGAARALVRDLRRALERGRH